MDLPSLSSTIVLWVSVKPRKLARTAFPVSFSVERLVRSRRKLDGNDLSCSTLSTTFVARCLGHSLPSCGHRLGDLDAALHRGAKQMSYM